MKLSFLRPLFIVSYLFVSTANAQVFYRGNDGDPETLDHHGTSTTSESRIIDDLYSGLVDFSADAKVIPATAKSWENFFSHVLGHSEGKS